MDPVLHQGNAKRDGLTIKMGILENRKNVSCTDLKTESLRRTSSVAISCRMSMISFAAKRLFSEADDILFCRVHNGLILECSNTRQSTNNLTSKVRILESEYGPSFVDC